MEDMKKHNHHNHEHQEGHTNHKGNHDHHKMMAQDFKTRFIISIILTIPILFLSPFIQGLLSYKVGFDSNHYIILFLSAIIFLYGGKPFFTGTYKELKQKNPGMMTLIGLAITVAFGFSIAVVFGLEGKTFFWDLATLIDVMLIGHYFEMKSVMGASKALEKLADLLPSTAHKVNGDNINDVKLDSLKKDDVVLVKPGEKMPSDGKIIDGESSVDESMISGESKPVKKKKNDKVIGGSINSKGSLKIKITGTGEDSYLSKVIGMVKKAKESKSKTQNLADRAAFYLTLISISIGLITLISWLTLSDKGVEFAIIRMVTVMVITCPHALGLAIPLVVARSTAMSASKGVLIRNRTQFEDSRRLQTIVFDKTGTLTLGEFGVQKVLSADDSKKEDEILKIIASLEQESEHPIGQAILEHAKSKEIDLYSVEGFDSITGKGIKGKIDSTEYIVCNESYLKQNNIDIPEKIKSEISGTSAFLIDGNKLVGGIILDDKVREESKDALHKLKEMGIKYIMLTGDSEEAAKKVAQELGIDEYYSQVLPEEKQEKIKEIQKKYGFTAMTGDGINDAPALAQADIGIAVGSGTDVAFETADIILAESNPMHIVRLIEFGKKTYAKMIQNLIWATAYNVVAIPLAAGVLYKLDIMISPAIGALFMSLSTVIVAINAKLLRF